jgi:hypothetical protein
MAVALLSVPVTAMNVDDDPLSAGIFETEEAAFRFPAMQDTNIDSITVGNDKAMAFGNTWLFSPRAYATNELEVQKVQDSGACETCCEEGRPDNCSSCTDPCLKVNFEQIKLGNREALAFGFATATNKVKISTAQN